MRERIADVHRLPGATPAERERRLEDRPRRLGAPTAAEVEHSVERPRETRASASTAGSETSQLLTTAERQAAAAQRRERRGRVGIDGEAQRSPASPR